MRSRLQALIAKGVVTLGGQTIRDPNKRVKPGDAVTIVIPPPVPAELVPGSFWSRKLLNADSKTVLIRETPGAKFEASSAWVFTEYFTIP